MNICKLWVKLVKNCFFYLFFLDSSLIQKRGSHSETTTRGRVEKYGWGASRQKWNWIPLWPSTCHCWLVCCVFKSSQVYTSACIKKCILDDIMYTSNYYCFKIMQKLCLMLYFNKAWHCYFSRVINFISFFKQLLAS